MRKLLALLIVLSLSVGGAGLAFAEKPVIDALDRHAVWTKWYDENGNRFSSNMEETESDRGSTVNVSTQEMSEDNMSTSVKRFDFIQETESYDYSKDRGDSA